MFADATSLERHDESPAAYGGRAPEAQIAEQERQLREILELCPAALVIVDDDGRLLFHNARLRELLGYQKEEIDLIDTRTFWHDLGQRSRIIAALRDEGGQLLNEKVVWKTKKGQLLNHYLTEMSRIALQFGATIDKYVGDAIVMFFGDPETRGVKEDALACVTMALAMQKRIGELTERWRDIGIEAPLQCRIGIHTGYCTVGNFGSEDRMGYTIVGGAVNLASRLEHEAPPGGVLISYETFVHVKDEIHCEERGHIHVKGIAYPVATYTC